MKYPKADKKQQQLQLEKLFMRGDKPEFRFTIARDTREQLGWTFGGDFEMVDKKLEVGDYTLAFKMEGHTQLRLAQNIFVVERKASAVEMIHMVGQDRDRWMRELYALEKIPHAFVICEFTLEEFLEEAISSGIMPSAAFGSISAWQYHVPIIFAGNRKLAEETFLCLARKCWKRYYLGHKGKRQSPQKGVQS